MSDACETTTAIDIKPKVYDKLSKEAKKQGVGVSTVANDLLRKGLQELL